MAIWISIAALIVSFASAVFTYNRNKRDISSRESHEYLSAASQLLKSAYDNFDRSRSDDWNDLPEPSRVLWLTVARQIQESTDISGKVTENTHRVLINQTRNHWRGQLRDLLEPLKSVSITYFVDDADAIVMPGQNQRMCVHEKSIRVVLEFLRWPDGMPDPIESVEQFSEAQVENMWLFEARPAAEFLQASAAMRGDNEDRKNFWRQKYQEAADAAEGNA